MASEVATSGGVDPLWTVALSDAAISPTRASLLVVPGDALDHRWAMHLRPGTKAFSEDAFPLDRDQLRAANDLDARRGHRVILRGPPDTRATVALLRHELEHARQYDVAPQTHQFAQIVVDALSLAFDELGLRDRPGSGTIYNLIPQELDANRAARALATALYGIPTAEELAGPHSALYRQDCAPEPETLVRRALALTSLVSAKFGEACRFQGRSVDQTLSWLHPDASAAWSVLQAAVDPGDWLRRAAEAAPAAVEVGRDGAPRWKAWERTVAVLAEGQAFAEAALPAGALFVDGRP
jgi:hypothetical protein